MKFDFYAEPAKVVEYLRQKRPEVHFDYDEIMHGAHHRAFTVAKITKLDLLSDVQESLAYAAENGLGFEEWKKSLLPTLAKKGWIGNVDAKDPKTGEIKQIYVGSRRLKNIYNTNMRVAYAVGAYEEAMSSDAQFLRYTAVLDSKTRASHRALHGVILPKDHPFWDTHYPPNAWNCRCKARAYTKQELKSRGWSITENIPSVEPHPDWAYNVGKTDNLDAVFADKVEKLKDRAVSKDFYENAKAFLGKLERKRNLYVWQSGLDEAVEQIIVKDDPKTPINMVQVGLLGEAIANAASKILGLDVNSGGIILTKDRLIHASPKRKSAYEHAFRVEEIGQIVKILDDQNNAYVDTRDDKNNIVFIFKDEKDDTKLNLIPIEISKTHKKFKIKNYLLTLDKANKGDIVGLIRNGSIKKVFGAGGI
ncbi:phage minor head protein [uncultured Campylobacter sp.]|uniref:phage head morphogenesis protein n=1 Tax=uncultured Campylobacter sp. TaxID=218934 RepID=UPI002625574C|nr:phage minor head protein [uncultured Campylobacter sp.]